MWKDVAGSSRATAVQPGSLHAQVEAGTVAQASALKKSPPGIPTVDCGRPKSQRPCNPTQVFSVIVAAETSAQAEGGAVLYLATRPHVPMRGM